MCFICTQLDNSFPAPKALARAYQEVMISGISDQEHIQEIEEKMDQKIKEQNLSGDELTSYVDEYITELARLGIK